MDFVWAGEMEVAVNMELRKMTFHKAPTKLNSIEMAHQKKGVNHERKKNK
jgi:hypothetical protein